jgi:small subunit ribosomal protein S7
MPRKKTKSLQREINPDRKYESVMVQKIINKLMRDGKKQKAESILYAGMEKAAAELKSDDAKATLEQAIKTIAPTVEVKSRRVGGANYQIPFEVKGERQRHLAIMWFAEAVKGRRKSLGKSSADAVAAEIVDSINKTGVAYKKREDTHKMAEANRAFAHFARY